MTISNCPEATTQNNKYIGRHYIIFFYYFILLLWIASWDVFMCACFCKTSRHPASIVHVCLYNNSTAWIENPLTNTHTKSLSFYYYSLFILKTLIFLSFFFSLSVSCSLEHPRPVRTNGTWHKTNQIMSYWCKRWPLTFRIRSARCRRCGHPFIFDDIRRTIQRIANIRALSFLHVYFFSSKKFMSN